ncbi:sodium/calcium exchanger NCL1 [Selaginella moellendorffii]|nr:sodium/calcium exchanger NCL1 [Selaginella moellendorffii]|eukprot:XP_002987555.2 sodium/calcium exchanger NCL1 [Selaginella moellendorffii]
MRARGYILPIFVLLACFSLAAAAAQLVSSGSSVDKAGFPSVLRLRKAAKEESCEPNYGFLPCSTGVAGNIFLLIVYGFLLLKAAQFLSEGSELLLLVLNPGIIGGLLLPILGALPDAILILVSGLFASEAEVLSQVLVGMGLLAGSTIMLLTLLWGSSLIVGRCDLQEVNGNLVAKDKTLTRKFDVSKTGVTTDAQTKVSAWIMLITVIPYILAQLPKIIRQPQLGRFFIILSCVLSFGSLLAYCIYQIMSPWIQQRRIALARQRFRLFHTLQKLSSYSKSKSWGDLVLSDGSTNTEALTKLFSYFDEDKSGHLTQHELKALIIGLGIGHESLLPKEEELKAWMSDFDRSSDDKISESEFISGFTRWIKDLQQPKEEHRDNDNGWDTEAQSAQTSYMALMDGQGGGEEKEEEESGESMTKNQIITKAVLLIVLGALIAGIFADPLVDSIENFSSATGIPSFFIAFVATPLATNSSEAISSVLFAAKKKKQNISLTYSQIYGGVTMNNTLCLGIFLAVVAYRGLTWDFSSEVLVITLVALIMGIFGGTRTTFPLWTSFIPLALYPLSILVVALLDYVLGWQ